MSGSFGSKPPQLVSRRFVCGTRRFVCGTRRFPVAHTHFLSSKTMLFEAKIYPQVGGYGRYNRLVAVFSWFPHFAVALNLFCDIFLTLVPESYHCLADPELLPAAFLLSNFSTQTYLNFTVPWLNGSGLSHCELYKYPRNWTNFTESAHRTRVPCTRGWWYGKAAGLQSNLVTQVRNVHIYTL